MSAEITRDEWLAALGDAAPPPCDPTSVTVRDLMAMFGLGRETAYRRALRLVEQGKATQTWKMVTGKSGVTKPVPAYRLVKSQAPTAAPTVGRGAGAASPSGIPTRRSRHTSPRRPRPTRRSGR